MNLPFDLSIDYFAVLGVHHGASSDQVKKAYRKMARRYHPDVSTIHDATHKFQEIANAYEILKKHRDEYCRQFEQRKRQARRNAQQFYRESTSQNTAGFGREFEHTQSSRQEFTKRDTYRRGKRAESKSRRDRAYHYDAHRSAKQPNSKQDAYSKFDQHGFRAPIHGKDRLIEYPLTLRYAIRQLRIGRFYVPGLKISMKFTRQAFENKTFRVAGKGYRGMFGGRDGDFLVRFQIRMDSSRFELKDGDIYAKFYVLKSLLKPGRTVFLDTPSGRVDLSLPEDFLAKPYFKIAGMGLPADDQNRAGDLYVQLLPKTFDQSGSPQAQASQNGQAQNVHSTNQGFSQYSQMEPAG